ncbi:hypothetical protein BASA61_006408 [Batrachochytrium salamandrivorans]|nr:hypothetical protein BASA61_006408 [Batrachochytrium salamandrivorans]
MPFQVVKVVNDAHDDGIWSVACSRRGSKFVTGSVDDTVKIWNTESMTLMHTLEGHQLGVNSVDISPNGLREVPLNLR